MDISFESNGRKWIARVWANEPVQTDDERIPYPEEQYVEINQWCIDTLKYHARTAYHVFEFKTKKDLEWFLLRWS